METANSNRTAALEANPSVLADESERRWKEWRWWGAVAGLLTGLVDAAIMAALGVRFETNGHNVTLLVGAYFGLSFAALGFLLGTVATDRMVGQYRTVVVADKGQEVLQKMADQTAGYAFFPKSLKDIERMRELIRTFIKSQYSMAYRSTNRKTDGSWRNIKIVCKRKGVTLRYRNGYFAR